MVTLEKYFSLYLLFFCHIKKYIRSDYLGLHTKTSEPVDLLLAAMIVCYFFGLLIILRYRKLPTANSRIVTDALVTEA